MSDLVIPEIAMLRKSIVIRLREDEYRALSRDAGGPGRIAPYLRGLVRGALWFNSEHGRAPEEAPEVIQAGVWVSR